MLRRLGSNCWAIAHLRRSSARPLTKRHYSTEETTTDSDTYCKGYVQKHDYEGFLISQFYPNESKGGYFALKAFSIELAKVHDNVSNQIIGNMRMQFWRDAVKDIQRGSPPRHPVAMALHKASQRSHLPTYHLKRIIDARDAELHNPAHLTMNSLIAHAESTSSTMLYLLLSLLNLSSSNLSHAASHLGTAQTIVTLLRALPYHVSRGHMVIPAELTAKHGVVQEDVFRHGPHAQGISDAVFEFATVANDHLMTAREMLKDEAGRHRVPRGAMPVFLGGVPVSRYLTRLEETNFNAFQSSLQQRDWRLAWGIWRGYYSRAF